MRKVSINESQFNRVIIRESEEMGEMDFLKIAFEIGKAVVSPEFSVKLRDTKTDRYGKTFRPAVIITDKMSGSLEGTIEYLGYRDGTVIFEYFAMMAGSTKIKADRNNLDKYLKYAFGFITSDNRLMT